MAQPVTPHFPLAHVYERPVKLTTNHPDMLRLYQKAKDQFWLPHDIDYGIDASDWASALTVSEKQLVERVLAFMTVAYGSLTDNMLERLCKEINILEATFFFSMQATVQNVHTESIARSVQCTMQNARHSQDILNSSIMLASVDEQVNWTSRWLHADSLTLSERLVSFVFAKAIFFHSGFAVADWLKLRGRLPGMVSLINGIAADGRLHTEFACLLLQEQEDLPDTDYVHKLVEEAVDIEATFILNALSLLAFPSLNVAILVEFIKYIADRTLETMGYEIRFRARNTLPFANAAYFPVHVNIDASRPRREVPGAEIMDEGEHVSAAASVHVDSRRTSVGGGVVQDRPGTPAPPLATAQQQAP